MANKSLNLSTQIYKGIPIRLIERKYLSYNAMRYVLNETNQNVWIPKKHLLEDGTIKPDENIDYVFRNATHKLELAGIYQAIIGIKRRTIVNEVQCDSKRSIF